MRPILKFAALGVVLSVPTVERAHAGSVLVLGPDFDDSRADVVDKLVADGRFCAVDQMDVSVATPTLAELLPYDSVIIWRNLGLANPTAMGNALADYVDAGGTVAEALFLYNPGGLEGRFITDGYRAIETSFGNLQCPGPMSILDASHPAMAGVTHFAWSNPTTCPHVPSATATPGAIEVARWTPGMFPDNEGVMVAVREGPVSGRVYALNFPAVSSDVTVTAPARYVNSWSSTGDTARLMANVLADTVTNYDCAPPPPDFDLTLSGTCPGTVTFDFTNGTPFGTIELASSPSTGTFSTPPSHPCGRVSTGLGNPTRLRATVTADGLGAASFSRRFNTPAACGVVMRALDVGSCSLNPMVEVMP